MKKCIYAALAAMSAVMMSCGSNNEFKVSGTIEGGTDSISMVLETASSGYWYFVDSVRVKSNGDFSVSQPAPQVPGIYRLRLGEQSIYFPIDSLDNITVNTKAGEFATAYTLSGTPNAELAMTIDKKAMELAKSGDEAAIAAWKKDLTQQILADPSGIVAYYVINKYIGSRPVFDPADRQDLKVIGAVANAYNPFRPTDPRTQYLVNLLLEGQRRYRAANGTAKEVVLQEVPIIEIALDDNHGKMQKLSEVAKQGKVVLLNFTMYSAEFSPAFNKELADIYKRYAGNLEIFQVSVDPDEFVWRQSAANLPWITVLDPASVQSLNLSSYNVMALPTSFIIDRNGEIVDRVDDATKLASTVAKYI